MLGCQAAATPTATIYILLPDRPVEAQQRGSCCCCCTAAPDAVQHSRPERETEIIRLRPTGDCLFQALEAARWACSNMQEAMPADAAATARQVVVEAAQALEARERRLLNYPRSQARSMRQDRTRWKIGCCGITAFDDRAPWAISASSSSLFV